MRDWKTEIRGVETTWGYQAGREVGFGSFGKGEAGIVLIMSRAPNMSPLTKPQTSGAKRLEPSRTINEAEEEICT